MNRSAPSLRIGSSLLGAGAVVLVIAACSTRSGFDEPTDQPPPFNEPDGRRAGPHRVRHPLFARPQAGAHRLRGQGAGRFPVQCRSGCGNGKCVDACTATVLTKGSAGCDFWTVPPDSPNEGRGGCFAGMIANTWDRAVSITAELGGDAFDISKATYTVARQNDGAVYTRLTGPLPPGQVAIVFFGHDDANYDERAARCPSTVTPALLIDTTIHGTGLNKAFHIKTDAPVSAYSIYPYGGADSFVPTATLLLPVSSWTQNYVAVTPFDFGETASRRSLQIIANEDNTEVRIKPTTDIAGGGGIAGAAKNVTQTWTLSKGQVLQFLQAPLSGSPIETSKPVGMFGGAECTDLPTPYCDTLQQQIPALRAVGHRVRGGPIPAAREQLLARCARRGAVFDRRRGLWHEAHLRAEAPAQRPRDARDRSDRELHHPTRCSW